MKTIPLLLIAGSLSLFAAGCGGDDEESGGTSTTAAARGYEETGQAIDDICQRAEAESKPISEKITGEGGEADAEALQELVDINEKYIAEVRDVKPDPELQAAYDGFVSGLDRMQELTEEAQQAAADNDTEGFRTAAEQLGELDKENDRLGKALGAPACATD